MGWLVMPQVSHECLVNSQGCVLFWTLSLEDRGLVVGSYGIRSWLARSHLGNCSRVALMDLGAWGPRLWVHLLGVVI